jgi:hypothetical protein
MPDLGNYRYPMVRGSGAFLVCIGLGLILAVVWAGDAPVNARILGVSAILATAAIPIMRKILPLGRPKAFHILAMIGSVALELYLFWLVFSRLPKDTQPQTRWLWALLLVGLHFIPMGLALGRRVVILGAACVAVAASALFFGLLPFAYAVVVDGILKAGFGASMAVTGLRKAA